MAEEVLYDEDHLKITYDKSNQWLSTDWKGSQSEQQIKKGGEKILECLKEKNCTKVLNDNTNVRSSWPHAVTWAAKVWAPAMVDAGLKYFAWIYPPEIFSRFSATRVVGEIEDHQREKFRFFEDIDEAREWLKKQR